MQKYREDSFLFIQFLTKKLIDNIIFNDREGFINYGLWDKCNTKYRVDHQT